MSGDAGTFGAFSQVGGTGDDAVEAATSTRSYGPTAAPGRRTLLLAGTFAGKAQFGLSEARGGQVEDTATGPAAFAAYYTGSGDLDVGTVKTYKGSRPVRVADIEPAPTQDFVALAEGSSGARDLVLWNLIGG